MIVMRWRRPALREERGEWQRRIVCWKEVRVRRGKRLAVLVAGKRGCCARSSWRDALNWTSS